jgi:hypothetical protein
MHNKYHNLPVPSMTVTGRYLAHNRLDLVRRAFLAADLHSGARRLVAPTVAQSAILAGVNRTYAHLAGQRQFERDAIEAGLIPLMPACARATGNGHGTSLVVPDAGIDDLQLMQIASVVGADRMLAAAVAMEAAE